MNARWFPRAALALLLIVGATLLGAAAYQAGLSAGLAADGSAVPRPGPGYGWYGGGFGFGFGFLGFLGTLLFFFLLFGLLRAAFWGGPGRWRDGSGPRPWEGRAREAFESWHREAHEPGTTAGPRPPGAGDATFGRS
jgi:hypothetical protein